MECGIAPEYVMDRMEWYEIETLIENKWRKERESWEQTRTVGYITAQCQSTKQIDPKKIIPFPWDRENPDYSVPTEEEREQIKREMKEMEIQMNKKK